MTFSILDLFLEGAILILNGLLYFFPSMPDKPAIVTTVQTFVRTSVSGFVDLFPYLDSILLAWGYFLAFLSMFFTFQLINWIYNKARGSG